MSYTAAWIIWLVMFGVIEGAALKNKAPGDTLSEHVWKWLKIKDKPRGWNLRRAGLGLFLVWLLLHLTRIAF